MEENQKISLLHLLNEKRLEKEILNISMNMSSVQAAKLISKDIADIGKSSICNLLKKNNPHDRQKESKKGKHR